MIYYITYITVWCFNLGQYSSQLHTHGGVRNTPIDRLISSMYQWHTYCLKTWIDWHVIHILYYDQTLINSTVHSLKINIAIFKVVPSALYWWRWQWVTQNSKSDEFPKKIVENVIGKYPSGVWWKKERRGDDTLIVIFCNFNLSKHSKGWGQIVKLKKKQEVLVRFGWNFAQLFRDTPWSPGPGYTQIPQVESQHLEVNIWAPCIRQHQWTKRKTGPIWVKLGSAVQVYTLK